MKRILCILMAMAILCAGAFAEADTVGEDVIDRFADVWVDTGVAVEIWYEEGFHCSAVLGNGEGASDVVVYDGWSYDGEGDCLRFEGGERRTEYYDETTGEQVSELKAEGLSAAFCFDGDDVLLWKDSEGIAADFALKRLTVAEEEDWQAAPAFVGRWGCGRCTIDVIDQRDGSYRVLISWAGSAAERTEWRYDCVYEPETGRMETYEPGSKETVTFAQDGSAERVRDEGFGGKASFILDDDGCLIWEDASEDAGEGMRFVAGE